MDKQIIRCPNCFFFSKRADNVDYFPLAQMLSNNVIEIRQALRIQNNEHATILIQGKDFELICGVCKQIAFKKTPVLITETTMLFGTMVGSV